MTAVTGERLPRYPSYGLECKWNTKLYRLITYLPKIAQIMSQRMRSFNEAQLFTVVTGSYLTWATDICQVVLIITASTVHERLMSQY